MVSDISQVLSQITAARTVNEAEVETKILLHIFRLLGYTDTDRADKPVINMYFGRERKQKRPDFIIYDGPERSIAKALIAVEAKAIGESLERAELQVRSYAAWAGTPYYIACNGETLLLAQFIPAVEDIKTFKFQISEIQTYWDELESRLQRKETILAKERLEYIAHYLPDIELLPASEFFKEYLSQLITRFSKLKATNVALYPPSPGETVLPMIPVTVIVDDHSLGENDIVSKLLSPAVGLYVEGMPGSGKSTLCRRVISRLAEIAITPGETLIPIYLNLSRGAPGTPVEALEFACVDMGIRIFPSLYERSLEVSRLILVLDGLDELVSTDANSSKLGSLIKQCSNHSVLITSRPSAATQYQHIIAHHKFNTAYIKELADEELRNVLKNYLHDSEQIDLILNAPSDRIGPNFRSPLMALMAIRIASVYPDWMHLSTYSLYVKYVEVLHSFFSATTVRGIEEPATLQEVLSSLSDASQIIRLSEPFGITLEEAINRLRELRYRDKVISGLLNTGLLTSSRGKTSFFHKTFEDFGLAWKMITSVRHGDAAGFAVRRPTEISYLIASSAVTESDENILRAWLSHSEKTVRLRSIGILKNSCSKETLNEIRRFFHVERSLRVWTTMCRILVNNKDPEFLEWLQAFGAMLPRKKTRILGQAIWVSGDKQFLPIILGILEKRKQPTLTRCLFKIALNHNSVELIDTLTYLYLRESADKKINLCGIIGQYRSVELARELIPRLLSEDRSPRSIIYLLNMYRDNLQSLPISIIRRVSDMLLSTGGLRTPERARLKRLNSFLKSLVAGQKTLSELSGVIEKIVDPFKE